MLGYNKPLESGLTLSNKNDIMTKYFIRAEVKDKIGVLGKIAQVLSDNSISIGTFLQKSKGKDANLLCSTHEAKEIDIQKALNEIKNLDVVNGKPAMIRIEE